MPFHKKNSCFLLTFFNITSYFSQGRLFCQDEFEMKKYTVLRVCLSCSSASSFVRTCCFRSFQVSWSVLDQGEHFTSIAWWSPLPLLANFWWISGPSCGWGLRSNYLMKSPITLKSHLKKVILISIVSFQVISISKVGNYDSNTLMSVLINQ